MKQAVGMGPDAASPEPTVLFLARSLGTGGAERQLAVLAAGLHARGWDVRVVTFYPGGPFEKQLLDAGVRVICLNKSGRWDVFGFFWRLVRLMRETRPRLAHGYLDVPNLLLCLARPWSPGTRVVWGVRASDMDASHYDLLFAIERYGAVALSRCADLIIFNSKTGRDYHVGLGYPAERAAVIPNGIDLEHFRPDAAARAALRSEWGIRAEENLIGLVGRLDPMKDHETFLRAAALLLPRDNTRFICVGDGPEAYREGLVSLARDLGLSHRLLWSPARTDVWRVYNALDVAVSASSSGEGFSNTIAEAMATGLPCVVTDVGDSAALVQDFGRACRPGDCGALAAAIHGALDALPVDSARIRNHIAVNYSIDTLLSHSVQCFAPLIGSAPAAVHAPTRVKR